MKSDNLSSVDPPGSSQSISRQDFLEATLTKENLEHHLLELGMSQIQIAKKYKCDQGTIAKYMRELGVLLPRKLAGMNSDKVRKLLVQNAQFTDIQRSLLVGSSLGDGRLCKMGKVSTKNANFQCTHGFKQKEYLEWKHAILQPFSLSIRKMQKYDSYYFSTVCYYLFSDLYDMFYPQGKKTVPLNIAEYLDVQALSVLFGDDGHTDRSYSTLSVCCFSDEEIGVLQDAMQMLFDVSSSLHKLHDSKQGRDYAVLYFSVAQSRCLHSLIDPLLPECLDYKRLQDKRASTTIREAPTIVG